MGVCAQASWSCCFQPPKLHHCLPTAKRGVAGGQPPHHRMTWGLCRRFGPQHPNYLRRVPATCCVRTASFQRLTFTLSNHLPCLKTERGWGIRAARGFETPCVYKLRGAGGSAVCWAGGRRRRRRLVVRRGHAWGWARASVLSADAPEDASSVGCLEVG